MKATLTLLGLIALAVTLIAPFTYLFDRVGLAAAQWMMLIGTILWFAASGSKLLGSTTAATDGQNAR